jgi:hypothetical protein
MNSSLKRALHAVADRTGPEKWLVDGRFTLWKLTGHSCARPFPVWLAHSSYRLLSTRFYSYISSLVRFPSAMLAETLTIVQMVYHSLSVHEESREYRLFVKRHWTSVVANGKDERHTIANILSGRLSVNFPVMINGRWTVSNGCTCHR